MLSLLISVGVFCFRRKKMISTGISLLNKEEILSYFKRNIRQELIQLKEQMHIAQNTLPTSEYRVERRRLTDRLHGKLRGIMDGLLEDLTLLNNVEPDYSKTTAALLIFYCFSVIDLEYRQVLWSYDLRDLAIRTGELWEGLLLMALEYSPNQDLHRLVKENKRIKKENTNKVFIDSLKNEGFNNIDIKSIVNILLDHNLRVSDSGLDSDSLKVFETNNEIIFFEFIGTYGSNDKLKSDRIQRAAENYLLLNQYMTNDKKHTFKLVVRTVFENKMHNYLRKLKDLQFVDVFIGPNNINEMVQIYTGYDMKKLLVDRHSLNILNDFQFDETREFMLTHSSNDGTYADYYLSWFNSKTSQEKVGDLVQMTLF